MTHWRELIDGPALAAHALWLGNRRSGAGRLVIEDADLRQAVVPGRDYDGARFVRCDLAGALLSRVSAREAELVDCRFDDARLDGARLDGVRLHRSTLDRASLDGAHFGGAELIGCQLARAHGLGTVWHDARLLRVTLDRAALPGAQLARARLEQCSLREIDLLGADLTGLTVDHCDLTGARLDDDALARAARVDENLGVADRAPAGALDRVDLSVALAAHVAWWQRGREGQGRIDVVGVRCADTEAAGRPWHGARFVRGDFSRTNLTLTFFTAGELDRCRFHGAQLEMASFEGARLVDCVFDRSWAICTLFDGATLEGGSFVDAVPARTTWFGATARRVDFRRANIEYAALERARFNDCDFRDCDLSNARFDGSVLEGCDLRGANLEGARVRAGAFVRCALHGVRGRPSLSAESRFVEADLSPAADGSERVTDAELRRRWA